MGGEGGDRMGEGRGRIGRRRGRNGREGDGEFGVKITTIFTCVYTDTQHTDTSTALTHLTMKAYFLMLSLGMTLIPAHNVGRPH